MFRFLSTKDAILIFICALCSVIMGAVVPVFAFVIGNMIDSFGSNANSSNDALQNLYYFLILGAGAMIVATIMFAGWMISGERQAFRCRQ